VAKVTILRSFGPLDHLDLVTADDMREIGLLAREQIVRRTMAGRDADGAPFTPYSEGYAKAKAKALGALAGSRVNLQVSGGMLNDLTIVDVQADGDKASVTLGWTK
jgi:hypothetical protein